MHVSLRRLTHLSQKTIALLIIIFGCFTSAALIASAYVENPEPSTRAACAQLQAAAEFRCYAKHYALLTHTYNPAKAFEDMKQAYQNDSYVQAQCHQLAHVVGRTALKKYGSLGNAYPKGDSFCWSGYHHGITEQAIGDIGARKIKEQANTICAQLAKSKPYSFDHYNCVHGLGHGFMAVDNYELFTALDTCDRLRNDWDRSSCYGGVYMENVMVAARDDGYSKYLKENQPLYPCTAVENTYKEQCYLMQTSYALQQNDYDFKATFELCARADQGFANTCYQSIGRDASGSTTSDVSRTLANCRHGPTGDPRYYCMVGAVKDFVAYHHGINQANQLCQAFGGRLGAQCKTIAKDYYATF